MVSQRLTYRLVKRYRCFEQVSNQPTNQTTELADHNAAIHHFPPGGRVSMTKYKRASSCQCCHSVCEGFKPGLSPSHTAASYSVSGHGFQSHQSQVVFFGPDRLLLRVERAMGPVGLFVYWRLKPLLNIAPPTAQVYKTCTLHKHKTYTDNPKVSPF